MTTLKYLETLGETKIDFEFSRSETLNSLIYKKLPVVTICGTNGKGSTTALLENILIHAGYKVGAYTSPHLEHVRERIRINGIAILDETFERHGKDFMRLLEEKNVTPTYFEFLTFLALDIFQKENIDIAIFEVGLGGRLDSVNAIPRVGAVMTSISMDHQNYLGDTLVKITQEKLPIAQGAPFSVIAKQTSDVEEYIETSLTQPHLTEGKDFQHSGSSEMFIYQKDTFRFGPIKLALRADHQSSNAACAVTMAIYLQNKGWNISLKNIEAALSTTTNPGRIEKWTGPCELWLDVAHNLDAMEKLVQHLYTRDIVDFETVFGCASDKPWPAMIESPSHHTTFSLGPYPDTTHLESSIQLQDPIQCVEKLISQNPTRILITGSFYHVGEIRKRLPDWGASNPLFSDSNPLSLEEAMLQSGRQ
ncbi:MAG: Mur ligase family protein [Bdellovibrionota bacterium]